MTDRLLSILEAYGDFVLSVWQPDDTTPQLTLEEAAKEIEDLLKAEYERGQSECLDWWMEHKDDPIPPNLGIIQLTNQSERGTK